MVDLPLTNPPVLDSLHVYRNGLILRREDDWNLYKTGETGPFLVRTKDGDSSADRVEARYSWVPGYLPEAPLTDMLIYGPGHPAKFNRPDTSASGATYSVVGFNDSAWQQGKQGFYAAPSTTYPSLTVNEGDTTMPFPLDLWYRIEFNAPESGTYFWEHRFDNYGHLWIDGTALLDGVYATNSSSDPGYRSGNITLTAGTHAMAARGQGDSSVGDSVLSYLTLKQV